MTTYKSETALQSAIIRALTQAGIWVFRINSGSGFGSAGGRIRGAPKGTPDLNLVRLGAWQEVKLPGEKLNPDQVKWHARAHREGVRVAIVEAPDQALHIAQQWAADDIDRQSQWRLDQTMLKCMRAELGALKLLTGRS